MPEALQSNQGQPEGSQVSASHHQKEEFDMFNFLPSLLVLYLPVHQGSWVGEVGLRIAGASARLLSYAGKAAEKQ